MLSIYLLQKDPSKRWKEVTEAKPGHFTHHLELNSARDVDDQVRRWLSEAWEAAG